MPSNPGRKGWFRAGEVEITTTAIMVALGVVSMFVYAIDKVFLSEGIFAGYLVRDGEVWRVATWPLVNEPSIWTVISLAFFWFVGHQIEDEIGRVRFLVLEVVATIVSAAIVSAIPLTAATGGASGLRILAFGLLVVIAIRDPQRPFFFGIPLWILVAGFAVIEVLQLVGDRLWGQLLLEAAVIAVTLVGAAAYGLVDVLPFVPRVGAPRPSGGGRGRRKRAKGARGTVTQGPWSTPSGSAPAGPSRLEQAELDVLLDKIGQDGIDSLSKQERQRLDELSRKMRGS
jgi:membrane associated rhomboid family serine protease